MAEAILSFAVQSIGKLLLAEARFLDGVSDQVRQLHTDLNQMQWFAKYADKKQGARNNVQQWVTEFREIAYEANDVIEDYAFKVGTRRKDGFPGSLKRCACILSECHARHNLVLEIQSLRKRISDLTKNLGNYGVTAVIQEDSSSSRQEELRRTDPFVKEEDFVNLKSLDMDVEMIVKLLVDGEATHYDVVSIYGMGGLGKTTLAKQVYHRLIRLQSYFNGFAWVCISQQWKSEDILQRILCKLVPHEELASTKEDLANRIREVLQEKRCLIVLDDIWSKEAWDCLKDAFSISDQGSKMLVTTRSRDVALHIGPDAYHHQPRLLSAEESWELLQKKALSRKRGIEDLSKFEELGKKMLKFCGCLPLAVIILGGILARKESMTEWSFVHDNIKSYFEKGDNIGQQEGEMPRILSYSYYDLPYQLKPCFLYLGNFEEDTDIEAEMLYQMWMAEGMVLENDKIGQESMMDVAERYLEELANRCMVHVELGKGLALRRFKSCRLHDLMRDLCLLRAKEENFSKAIDLRQKNDMGFTSDNSQSLQSLYRLVIRLNHDDLARYVPPSKEQAKHLRSFMFVVLDKDNARLTKGIKSQFSKFKMLRVLVIEGQISDELGSLYEISCNCCIPDMMDNYFTLPKSIGKLVHLIYLSLRGFGFFVLPSTLGKLEYLETLDLSSTLFERIPNDLSSTLFERISNGLEKMRQLRHLYLPFEVNDLSCSKWLLDGLEKLEILEFHSSICDAKSFSKSTSLRRISVTVACRNCSKLEDVPIIIRHVSKLSHLRSAWLAFSSMNNYKEWGPTVIQEIFSCQNLEKLKISRLRCRQLPSYQLHFFPLLSELTLELTQIDEDPMGTLERFPNLRKLQLLSYSFVEREITCHAMGFPQLETLVLSWLPRLQRWNMDEGSMPKLSFLKIERCGKLHMVPDELRSKTNLRLHWVQRDGEIQGRISNLPI